MRPLSQQGLDRLLPWVASGAAIAGLAVIGVAGEPGRSIPVAVVLAGVSIVLSFVAADSAASPTRRTLSAATALGTFAWASLVGILSFGAAVIPAAASLGLALWVLDHPSDSRQVFVAGIAVGAAVSTAALLLAGAR